MRPTREQIELAAYHRWQRRGWSHGSHDGDWVAAEKDLTFALNYRYVARYKLVAGGEPLLLGQAEAEASGQARRCRFCERSEPTATFRGVYPALPVLCAPPSLIAWDDCDECHRDYLEHLAEPYEAFLGPLLHDPPARPASVSVPALKALVRAALGVMPISEIHHFGDTIEWISNPDHDHDAALLAGLGCFVYETPVTVPSGSAAVARRVSDDADMPYMIAFLALSDSRVVLQTPVPFCPRDEDLEDGAFQSPELSMSLGQGPDHRSSDCHFIPVDMPATWSMRKTRAKDATRV